MIHKQVRFIRRTQRRPMPKVRAMVWVAFAAAVVYGADRWIDMLRMGLSTPA